MRVKITPREKRRHAVGRSVRSRFARLTIPEKKWGTTRSLDNVCLFELGRIGNGGKTVILFACV